MKKKIFVFIISIVLIISLCQNFMIFAIDIIGNVTEEEITINNIYNKLHFYLDNEQYYTIDSYSELVEATNYAVSNISQYSIVSDETSNFNPNVYQMVVEFDSEIEKSKIYQEFIIERDAIESTAEVRDFRRRLNEYSKAYHRNMIENKMDIISSIEYCDCEHIDYSPFVVLTIKGDLLKSESLVSVIQSDEVFNVSIRGETNTVVDTTYTDVVDKRSWIDVLEAANAFDIVSARDYTGNGIRIGICEVGVCDTTHVNLYDKDITVHGTSISSHATLTTSIVALIAPDAEIFSCSVSDANGGIQWFIDQGCDIVNCSFGYEFNTLNSDGTYTLVDRHYRADYDGLYDYQIKTHFITAIVASNNLNNDNTSLGYNPNNEVCSPGYAYNAITVGGLSFDNNNRIVHYSTSSYVSDEPIIKPNISAMGIVNVPNIGVASGTSVAAPQVTGYVALLMEKNAFFCCNPDAVLSIVTSTADKTYDYSAYTNTYQYFDDKVGAGVINLDKMLGNINYIRRFNYDGCNGETLISIEVHLAANTEVQIATSWLAHSNRVLNETYVTDYDIVIYDPDGWYLDSSALTESNVELIRFTTTESGVYTITVEQWDDIHDNNNGDPVTLTYYYQ